MHYYQFNIGDYAKHTRHLTNNEDLAYRRMIDHCYLNEEPLIDDVKKIARLINMRGCEDDVKNVLDDFFELLADGWHNSRVDKDLVDYAGKAERARQNGKKGGRPPKQEAEKPKKPTARFSPPSIEEATTYFGEKAAEKKVFISPLEPEKFINFYESKNWMVGKNKMKDWKAAIRTWLGNVNSPINGKPAPKQSVFDTQTQNYGDDQL